MAGNTRTTKSAPHGAHKHIYDSYGTGTHALVFLHGWCCNRFQWQPQQQPLFAKYRTLIIDVIGHGESDAPSDFDYGTEMLAESVVSVLKHEGIEKAVLVGHSMGGVIATMILRLHTELVGGIVYVDSFLQPPESYKPLSARQKLLQPMLEDDAQFKKVFGAMVPDPELRESLTGEMVAAPKVMRMTAATTATQFHSFRHDEVYDGVPAKLIQTPVLKSGFDPRWKIHVPMLEVEHEEWTENGHWLFIESPERFNRSVEAFLRKHGLDASLVG